MNIVGGVWDLGISLPTSNFCKYVHLTIKSRNLSHGVEGVLVAIIYHTSFCLSSSLMPMKVPKLTKKWNMCVDMGMYNSWCIELSLPNSIIIGVFWQLVPCTVGDTNVRQEVMKKHMAADMEKQTVRSASFSQCRTLVQPSPTV